ncbi:TonB-dependent receptor plug domain-containing protein, partial [Sutterella wadsworthensis]
MKTYTHNLLSAAVVAAITFSGAAIADEYQTLETTTVTAGRFEQDLMETPMSVSVITADDIAKSGAQSIGALIESMTGVRINNDGGQGIKRAKIRGEDAFRSLVMIDGQKISEQKS